MRFLSTILTATLASSLTSASALPPVDHSDTSVNLETKPALSAWLYGLLIPGERLDNGAYCRAGSNCKSSFCMGQRCATNQCKTTEDCGEDTSTATTTDASTPTSTITRIASKTSSVALENVRMANVPRALDTTARAAQLPASAMTALSVGKRRILERARGHA